MSWSGVEGDIVTGLDVSLLRPFWVLALIPLAIFGRMLLNRQSNIGSWEKVANPRLLQAMQVLGRIEQGGGRRPGFVALIATALIVLALSGPAIDRRDAVSFRNLDAVVFVVDVSRSVTETDTWPQLQTIARFGIESLRTRPAAMVVFAGDAYVATDLTHDHRQLGQTLSLLDKGTVPDPGSRPERALLLASQILANAKVLAGDVIMFTDGDGLGPETLDQVAQLTQAGTRVSFVATGQNAPSFETHAKIGTGRSFELGDIDALSNWLQADGRTRLEQQDFPLLFVHDLGRYVLLFALVPLLMMFRRTAP